MKYLNIINYIKYIYRFYLKLKLKKCGKNVIFDPFSNISDYSLIEMHDNVYIGPNAYISANLVINKNVMFGPNVSIIGGDHSFAKLGKSVRFLTSDYSEKNKIVIEDDCWIGANTTILKGVNLGIGSVVGASSLVSKDIPPFVVAVGNPAKVKSKIFTDDELIEHLKILQYDSNIIDNIISRRNKYFGMLNG